MQTLGIVSPRTAAWPKLYSKMPWWLQETHSLCVSQMPVTDFDASLATEQHSPPTAFSLGYLKGFGNIVVVHEEDVLPPSLAHTPVACPPEVPIWLPQKRPTAFPKAVVFLQLVQLCWHLNVSSAEITLSSPSTLRFCIPVLQMQLRPIAALTLVPRHMHSLPLN